VSLGKNSAWNAALTVGHFAAGLRVKAILPRSSAASSPAFLASARASFAWALASLISRAALSSRACPAWTAVFALASSQAVASVCCSSFVALA